MKFILLGLLALGYQSASAESLLQTFGSGTNQFSIEFVTIGQPNNTADTSGSPNPAGSVAYIYNLGKHEVSRDMITKANAAGSLELTMYDMDDYGGNGVDKPATGVSWYEAAKFVNWLNTSTGGTAAYKFDGSGNFQPWSPWNAGYNSSNNFRNRNAKFWISSTDEWYKGAYGNPNGSWSNFPNGNYDAPEPVPNGTDPDTAVYDDQDGPADIKSAGGLSAYGTMAQGGNAWEWMETAYDGTNEIAGENRELRGGSWYRFGSVFLDSSERDYNDPSNEDYGYGLRVASVPEPSTSVPEPSTGLLLLLGLSGLLLKRRK